MEILDGVQVLTSESPFPYSVLDESTLLDLHITTFIFGGHIWCLTSQNNKGRQADLEIKKESRNHMDDENEDLLLLVGQGGANIRERTWLMASFR